MARRQNPQIDSLIAGVDAERKHTSIKNDDFLYCNRIFKLITVAVMIDRVLQSKIRQKLS
jgi:hypothetical protein